MFAEKDFSEDNLLWNEYISGDKDAYIIIYKKYSKKLFIQGLQFTSDRELIQDCIHDLFVKIHRDRERMKPLGNLQTYLFVALRNNIITVLKKRKVSFETLDELSETGHILDGGNTDESLINKETELAKNTLVANALNTLTLRQREAVHYRFYENMNIEKIAVLMEMNYQSVQNLIQRSLKKISLFLKKGDEISEPHKK